MDQLSPRLGPGGNAVISHLFVDVHCKPHSIEMYDFDVAGVPQ